jgi:hypothetical protein
MKLANGLSVSFKEGSSTHYVLQYLKFSGGVADVTKSADLFRGKIQDKNKAKRAAAVLVKDGCIQHVKDNTYRMTRKGLEVFTGIVQQRAAVRVERPD